MDATTAARIADDAFARATELASVPAIAYGLVHDGALVHAGGRATAGREVPGPDAVFRIASMTKSFTAAAVLMLRDQERLRLDDPVASHLPFSASIAAPEGPPITIRDLLTMGSGLATDDPWGDRLEELPTGEFDDLVAGGLSFCRPPRMGFEYSNTGYALLGRVIDVVSGMPYRDFVEDRICAPLGLAATAFDADRVPAQRRVTGYRIVAGAEPIAEPVVGPGAYSAMGGLHSSVRDLATWVGGFAAAWSSSPQHPVGRWSLREAQESARFVGLDHGGGTGDSMRATGYGYGLYVQQDDLLGRVVSHSGGYPGFGSHMRWHPGSGWGVIALGNATYAPMHVAASAVLARIVVESGSAHGARAPIPVAPWPRTLAAMDLVEHLLSGRQGADLEDAWSPNMDLDIPRNERVAALSAVRDAIGAPRRVDGSVEHATPGQASWMLTGDTGTARVELMMTPERTPRIQALVVKVGDPVAESVVSTDPSV